MSSTVPEIDLHEIVDNHFLVTHFQPQVSLKRKAVVGLEALSRGFDSATGELISPTLLFEQARTREARLALDRCCRAVAVESFALLHRKNRNLMLSMNIDASCINEETRGSNHVLNLVKQYGISGHDISLTAFR